MDINRVASLSSSELLLKSSLVNNSLDDDLDAALSKLKGPPFDVALCGVDAFGGDKVRHLYARVEPSPALFNLHAAVAQAARSADVALEARRYVPHVTLARMGGRRPDERIGRWFEGASAFRCAPFAVDGFALFSSSLGNGPPVYRIERRYPLAGHPA